MENESGPLSRALQALTDEQREQAKYCKTAKELFALLSELGVALPDELLDAATGGATYRYNSEYKCFEIIAKDGYTVLELDPFCVDEKDAAWWANYYSEMEDAGMV